MAIDFPDCTEITPTCLFERLKSGYLNVILVDVTVNDALHIPGARCLERRILRIMETTKLLAKSPLTEEELIQTSLTAIDDPYFQCRQGQDIIVYDDYGNSDDLSYLITRALIEEGLCAHVYHLSGGIRAFAEQYPQMMKKVHSYARVLPKIPKSLYDHFYNGNESCTASKFISGVPHRVSTGPTKEIVKALGEDVHPVDSYTPTVQNDVVDETVKKKRHYSANSGTSNSNIFNDISSRVSGNSLTENHVSPPRRSPWKPPLRESSLSYDHTLTTALAPPTLDVTSNQSELAVDGSVTETDFNPFTSFPQHKWALPLGDQGLDTNGTGEIGDFTILNDEDSNDLLHLSATSNFLEYYQGVQDQYERRRYNHSVTKENDDELDDLVNKTTSTPEPVSFIKAKQLYLVDAVWYDQKVPFRDEPLPILDGFLYLGSQFAARPDLLKKYQISNVLRLGWGFPKPEQYDDNENEVDFNVLESGESDYNPFETDTVNSAVNMMNDDHSQQQQQQLAHDEQHTPCCEVPKVYIGSKSPHRLIPKKVKYHDFLIEDSPNEPIEYLFEKTGSLIEEARVKKERILVHCHAGVSRSTTIVLAYLIRYHRVSLYDAWNLVYINRPIVRPNDGFARALQEYEKELLGVDKASLPVFWMSESYTYYLEYLEWYARMHSMKEHKGGSEQKDVLMNLMANQYKISRKIMSGDMPASLNESGVTVESIASIRSMTSSPTLPTVTKTYTPLDEVAQLGVSVDISELRINDGDVSEVAGLPDDRTLMKEKVGNREE